MRNKMDQRKRRKRRDATYTRRKFCRLCVDKIASIDYKDSQLLSPYLTERGKIIPRRLSGLCAKHQRDITTAIKRARIVSLIPFTTTQVPIT